MSVEEARLAVTAGASALGLVGEMPSGPGVIDDALIAEIVAAVPPPVATFLLTSETRADAIIDHLHRCGTNTVQLVDRPEEGAHAAIRRAQRKIQILSSVGYRDLWSN